MMILETQGSLNLCYTVFKQNLYLVISKNTLEVVALWCRVEIQLCSYLCLYYSNCIQMYFSVFSVKWSMKIMWLSIFIIFNFYQKHYDHCHNQKVFFSKNKYIFGHKNPKKNFSIAIQIWTTEYIYQGFRNLFKCSRLPIFWLRRLSLLLNIYNVYKILLLGFIGTTKYLKLHKQFWLL